MPIDIPKALSLLDKELSKKNFKADLTICGGAALILMGIVSRETVDVDVVAKEIPIWVLTAAKVVAKKLKCREDWLNNKVNPLIERLPSDWEEHLITLFTGAAITVRSISRQDLISVNFTPQLKGGRQIIQMVDLKPTSVEIETAKHYCLKQSKNETYEVWVNRYVKY